MIGFHNLVILYAFDQNSNLFSNLVHSTLFILFLLFVVVGGLFEMGSHCVFRLASHMGYPTQILTDVSTGTKYNIQLRWLLKRMEIKLKKPQRN